MQYQMQMSLGDEDQGYEDGEEEGGFGQPPPSPVLGPTVGGGQQLLGREEQKGWMDRTLQAAGLDDDDDDDNIPLHQVRSSEVEDDRSKILGDNEKKKKNSRKQGVGGMNMVARVKEMHNGVISSHCLLVAHTYGEIKEKARLTTLFCFCALVIIPLNNS